jgi:hypothetical protein
MKIQSFMSDIPDENWARVFKCKNIEKIIEKEQKDGTWNDIETDFILKEEEGMTNEC